MVWSITGLAAAIYATYALVSFARFRASAYDLVIFDQAIRGYARFGAPISVIKGVHNDFGSHFSILGDHWSPILATLAPLYHIHDGPETLLAAQAILLAAAIPPLWAFTFKIVKDLNESLARHARWMAYCVAIIYAIAWPVAEAVAFDFHEAAFVPLLTVLTLERYHAGRKGHAIAAGVLLLLVKEDMGLLIAGLGVSLLVQRKDIRLGIGCVAAGLTYSIAAIRYFIPAAGGRANYYWAYSRLGDDFGAAALYALTHPLVVAEVLVSPVVKVQTLALLFAPMMFTSLFSPITIAAVPLLLERMLSSSFPNWWAAKYHYNLFIFIIVLMGGLDGILRLERLLRRSAWARRARSRGTIVRTWAICSVALGVASIPLFSFGGLFTPRFYALSDRVRAAAQATSMVPDGVLVEAANNLAPALSARTTTLLWDRTPRWAPWVVADVGRKTFPFLSADEQRDRISLLRGSGYTVEFEREGYLVLSRRARPPGGPSGPAAARTWARSG